MRNRALGVIVFLLSASAFAVPPQVLGTRSAHYDLHIERSVISPEQTAYDLSVTDLDNGAVVLKLLRSGSAREPVNADSVSGEVHLHIRLSYTQNFFSATFAAVRGNTVIDESRTWWQLEPRTQGVASSESAGSPGLEVRHINAPGAYRVGGDVTAPVVVHRVDPIYPEAARRDHISGIGIAEVLVGKDGRVKDAIALSALPGGLTEAMLDAIRQWEFKPGTRNGVPVDVIFNLTTNFKLDGTPHPAIPPPQ